MAAFPSAALTAAPPPARRIRRSVIPGLGLTLGCSMAHLGALVLAPLAALAFTAAQGGVGHAWDVLSTPRVFAAFRLSFGAAVLAAVFNGFAGLLIAWALTRHRFPCRRLMDAVIDLPFALPTAVAGVALTALFAPNGPFGAAIMEWTGWRVAFTPLGVGVALVFVGLPFVVRAIQPVLEDFPIEEEEAARALGASRWGVFRRVILPAILPAALTGVGLAFARGVGEYGSVIFIAGNLPMLSEIAPLLIVIRLEEFDYPGAAAIACAMLALSFATLLALNLLQARMRRHDLGN